MIGSRLEKGNIAAKETSSRRIDFLYADKAKLESISSEEALRSLREIFEIKQQELDLLRDRQAGRIASEEQEVPDGLAEAEEEVRVLGEAIKNLGADKKNTLEILESYIARIYLDNRTKIFDKFNNSSEYLPVFNKNHFRETVRQEMGEGNDNLCYMFFDVDGLKAINDIMQHEKGDEYLGLIMQAMQEAVLEIRQMIHEKYPEVYEQVRFHISAQGGDEFGILIVGPREKSVFDVAEWTSNIHSGDERSEQRVDILLSTSFIDRLKSFDLEKIGIISMEQVFKKFSETEVNKCARDQQEIATATEISDELWRRVVAEYGDAENLESLRYIEILRNRYKENPIPSALSAIKLRMGKFVEKIGEERLLKINQMMEGSRFPASASFGVNYLSERRCLDKDLVHDEIIRIIIEACTSKTESEETPSLSGLLVGMRPAREVFNEKFFELIEQPEFSRNKEATTIGIANYILHQLDSQAEKMIHDIANRRIYAERMEDEIRKFAHKGSKTVDEGESRLRKINSDPVERRRVEIIAKMSMYFEDCDQAMIEHKTIVRNQMRQQKITLEAFLAAKERFEKIKSRYEESLQDEKTRIEPEYRRAEMEYLAAKERFNITTHLLVLTRSDEMRQLEESADRLLSMIKVLENSVNKLDKEIEQDKEKLSDLSMENDSLKKEVDRLVSENSGLEERDRKSAEKIRALEEEVARLKKVDSLDGSSQA